MRSRTLRAHDGGLSSDQNPILGQEGRSEEKEGKGGAFLKSNLKLLFPYRPTVDAMSRHEERLARPDPSSANAGGIGGW